MFVESWTIWVNYIKNKNNPWKIGQTTYNPTQDTGPLNDGPEQKLHSDKTLNAIYIFVNKMSAYRNKRWIRKNPLVVIILFDNFLLLLLCNVIM